MEEEIRAEAGFGEMPVPGTALEHRQVDFGENLYSDKIYRIRKVCKNFS